MQEIIHHILVLHDQQETLQVMLFQPFLISDCRMDGWLKLSGMPDSNVRDTEKDKEGYAAFFFTKHAGAGK
jgi:hypothetical protein